MPNPLANSPINSPIIVDFYSPQPSIHNNSSGLVKYLSKANEFHNDTSLRTASSSNTLGYICTLTFNTLSLFCLSYITLKWLSTKQSKEKPHGKLPNEFTEDSKAITTEKNDHPYITVQKNSALQEAIRHFIHLNKRLIEPIKINSIKTQTKQHGKNVKVMFHIDEKKLATLQKRVTNILFPVCRDIDDLKSRPYSNLILRKLRQNKKKLESLINQYKKAFNAIYLPFKIPSKTTPQKVPKEAHQKLLLLQWLINSLTNIDSALKTCIDNAHDLQEIR